MMNKCLKLVKVQLLGQLRSAGKTGKLALMGLLGLMICGYSFLLAYGLGSAGIAEVIPSYAIAITSMVTIFFTFL